MSINSNTLHGVPQDWRAYSGTLSRRVFAFMIDYLMLSVICVLLSIATIGIGFFFYPTLFILVAGLYFGLTIGGPRQASLGMRAMGIAVIRVDGKSLDFLTAIVHMAIFWILNAVLTPFIVLAGLFIERNRLVHDLLTGTAVIRTA
ncbi:RDD family protein [Oryzifoliimicrobium ureilyticus]|uniref:RDD family protein n=1 Tax=Oryzifoliimicrobium ureilyticus TaxID=3113724 RepID=UPI00307680F1